MRDRTNFTTLSNEEQAFIPSVLAPFMCDKSQKQLGLPCQFNGKRGIEIIRRVDRMKEAAFVNWKQEKKVTCTASSKSCPLPPKEKEINGKVSISGSIIQVIRNCEEAYCVRSVSKLRNKSSREVSSGGEAG